MSEPLRTWPVRTLPMRRGGRRTAAASSAGPPGAWPGGFRRAGRLRRSGRGTGSGRGSRRWRGGRRGGTVLDPELAGGLALGGEVFGLLPFVHQPRCEQRDLPADSCISHVLFSPRLPCPEGKALMCGGGRKRPGSGEAGEGFGGGRGADRTGPPCPIGPDSDESDSTDRFPTAPAPSPVSTLEPNHIHIGRRRATPRRARPAPNYFLARAAGTAAALTGSSKACRPAPSRPRCPATARRRPRGASSAGRSIRRC